MAEHDTNNIQAMLKFCPRFDGKSKAKFLEYKGSLCVVLSFYRQRVTAILQGDPKTTGAQNKPAVTTWEHANENLFSITFFTTERSANNVGKTHMSKIRRVVSVSVTGKQHGVSWKRSTTATPTRLGGRTTKSYTVPR